jgi:hypothetical protein
MEVIGQYYAPASLPPRMNPGPRSVEGWVGPREVLDVLEKIKISCSCRCLNPGSSSPLRINNVKKILVIEL